MVLELDAPAASPLDSCSNVLALNTPMGFASLIVPLDDCLLSNNNIEYNVNPNHPLYETMRNVVMMHLGLDDIVETVLEKMGNIEKIILIGDYAKGIDSGNIEVILTGRDLDMEYISNIENKIEKLINRKVTFYLSSKFLSEQQNIILYTNEV